MQSQNNHKSSPFWFGFLLGGLMTGSAAFLLGTKQGRKILKQILESSENLEETIAILFEEFGNDFKDKGEEILAEISHEIKNHTKKPEPHTLTSLIDRIKTLSPVAKKDVKKFFMKD